MIYQCRAFLHWATRPLTGHPAADCPHSLHSLRFITEDEAAWSLNASLPTQRNSLGFISLQSEYDADSIDTYPWIFWTPDELDAIFEGKAWAMPFRSLRPKWDTSMWYRGQKEWHLKWLGDFFNLIKFFPQKPYLTHPVSKKCKER
jgi:hypothetical protein